MLSKDSTPSFDAGSEATRLEGRSGHSGCSAVQRRRGDFLLGCWVVTEEMVFKGCLRNEDAQMCELVEGILGGLIGWSVV